MIFEDLREQYPHFVRIASFLEETSALFMAMPLRQLREAEPDYEFVETLCRDAYALCDGDQQQVLAAAEGLIPS